MFQKVNPASQRIGVIKDWGSNSPVYIEPTYYAKYYYENDPMSTPHYKKLSSDDPAQMKYEKGIKYFLIKKFIKLEVNEVTYYIDYDYDNNERKYAFGELATGEEILKRINNGEEFAEDYEEILKDYRCQKFFITGLKDIGFDKFDQYIPIDRLKTYETTPDEEINENRIIRTKALWFIEYTSESGYIGHQVTYCNDMIFRRPDGSFDKIKSYRFIKGVSVEIDNKYFTIFFEKGKIKNKDIGYRQYSDIDIAVDESKYLIFNNNSKKGHLFNGYTPVYPFNTEDISSVFNIRQEYIKDCDVMTVTGSGDSLIDLFLYGANNVTCFDTNKLAKYWAKLKFYAIKGGLTFEEFLEFFQGFNEGDQILNINIYRKFYEIMDSETRRYWNGIYKYLKASGEKLVNNSHYSLTYSLIGYWGSSNCSFDNPSSYCNKDNYVKVQEILQTKTIDDITFIDSPLFELDDKLGNKKFNYIYLSNIMDFTSTFINDNDLNNRLNIFKKYIKDKLSQHVATDGLIDLAYIKYFGIMNFNICVKLEQYQEVFGEDEGFKLEDLLPYNNIDHIMGFRCKGLELKK